MCIAAVVGDPAFIPMSKLFANEMGYISTGPLAIIAM